ncbi:hypothetical protein P3G55_18645 [Leptospira sp. 96542]|nr:hypothetical protein [Leptospira sp. 96542]
MKLFPLLSQTQDPIIQSVDLIVDDGKNSQSNQPKIYMIRDDLLPLGFGTKWRKLESAVQFFRSTGKKHILLWGALHGNYLASFSLGLRMNGFEVTCFAYAKDPSLHTFNETIVKRHTHNLTLLENRNKAEKKFEAESIYFPDSHLPEFGIHPSLTKGLISYFTKLKNQIISLKDKGNSHQKKSLLVLDIGSGVSFLCALQVFSETDVEVFGILASEPKSSWVKKAYFLQNSLGLDLKSVDPDSVLDFFEFFPNVSRQFGKPNQWIYEKVRKYFQMTKILLEPIYSAKSILCLEKVLENNDPTKLGGRDVFYLHQGGQNQHLDIILER